MLLPLLLLLSIAGTIASAVMHQNQFYGLGISKERLMTLGPGIPRSFEVADENFTLDVNDVIISSFFKKQSFFGPITAVLQLIKKNLIRWPTAFGTSLLCACVIGLSSPRLSFARSLDDMTLHKKMKPHEVVYRVMKFWMRTGPLILHYQFCRFWMNRIKRYDDNSKEVIYQRLHKRYSPQALEIILDMKGETSFRIKWQLFYEAHLFAF